VSSFLVKYCDTVLKRLPDARTFVSLRQRLQQQQLGGHNKKVGVSEDSSKETVDLVPEDKIRNAGL
jgi:hypothetical protein